jgi:DNA polymerase III alpha subunit
MSDFIQKRSILVNNVDNLLESISSRREAKKNDADDLFNLGSPGQKNDSISLNIPKVNKSKLELLVMEKEILGLYVSGNPLSEYRELQNWLRNLVDEPNLHLILVEKIKKIFTRNNLMMLGLNVTTPTEQLEGVVFPKLAHELSQIITEKEIFWVKGQIKESEQKRKEESEDGEMREFIEAKKIIIEDVSPFNQGIMKFLTNQTITISTKEKLEHLDWKALLHNPKEIKNKEKNDQKEAKLILDSRFGIDKIKEIKSKILTEARENTIKIAIWVEHNGKLKKVQGEKWIDENYFISIS